MSNESVLNLAEKIIEEKKDSKKRQLDELELDSDGSEEYDDDDNEDDEDYQEEEEDFIEGDNEPALALVEFSDGVTNRGMKSLWHAGFRYTHSRRDFWRCSLRKCHGSAGKVRECADGITRGRLGKKAHNHLPESPQQRELELKRQEIRLRIREDPWQKNKKIFSDIDLSLNIDLKQKVALRQFMRREKVKLIGNKRDAMDVDGENDGNEKIVVAKEDEQPKSVEFEEGVTARGQKSLWFSGFRYTHRKFGNWRCFVRDCKASVTNVRVREDGIIQGKTGKKRHNHLPCPEKRELELRRSEIRKQVREDPDQKPAKVLSEARTKINDPEYFEKSDAALRRLITREKAKLRGSNGDGSTQNVGINLLPLEQLNDADNDGQLFEYYDGNSHDDEIQHVGNTIEVVNVLPHHHQHHHHQYLHPQQQQPPLPAQSMEMEAMSAQLFVELMRQFFSQGWMLGSSGGMMAIAGPPDTQHLLASPSSVPKERLAPSDLFLFDRATILQQQTGPGLLVNAQPLHGPVHLRPSACTPLFLALLQSSPGAECAIHTHSKCANLVTARMAGRDRLEIRDQEMLKGVFDRVGWRPLQNTDRFVLPIIENAPTEQQLLPALQVALVNFPHSPAILVRRHGLFVWGPSWQKTKVMLECLEYMLELAWEMGRAGMDIGLPLYA